MKRQSARKPTKSFPTFTRTALGGATLQLVAKVVVFKCKVSTQVNHATLGQDQSVKLSNLSRKKRAIHLQVGFWKCNVDDHTRVKVD